MKKNIIYGLLFGVSALTSCEDFTEIQPKGANLLSTTDELELLLNQEFYDGNTDMRTMCGDMIYAYSSVATQLAQPSKTRNVIMWTWDEDNLDKMAELTSSDTQYTNFYGYIGTIANPILTQVDAADGDENAKNQLKCEALVMRAYYHYLLVNKFAHAYNPSTASTDPGIIYMTEDMDITENYEKNTVQEVYDKIIADCDEAIALDGLPTENVNRMRFSKPCAYAVKALALLNMQDWDGAQEAAEQALAINGTVNNYNEMLTTTTGYIFGYTYDVIYRPRLECEEDLFSDYDLEFFNAITTEAWEYFEEGHACKEKMGTMDMLYDYYYGEGGVCYMYTGLYYTYTYDLSSDWNPNGMKTTYLYLAVAECELHSGNIDKAMAALDKIRVNRIDPEVYEPLEGNVTSPADAIAWIKKTAHGEDIYTCYGFINKKRWTQVDDWKETITKEMFGVTYSLAPDSKMWIFPFPSNATAINPYLTQNYSE